MAGDFFDLLDGNLGEDDSVALEQPGQVPPVTEAPAPSQAASADPPQAAPDASSAQDMMASIGLGFEKEIPDITKPWMKHHEFVLVDSVEQVNAIVDKALETHQCALDVETEGLDNRVDYDESGRPRTKHQIVGYCLSPDGKTGYYIPVRHLDVEGYKSRNLPVDDVEAAIRRLCQAAQPVLTDEEKLADPLGGRRFAVPPRVVIYFWHSKFDQEMLYPVTGIDFWHPDSFEDGLLACWVDYTDDKDLGLKAKSKMRLKDPDGNPYEMIELKELFVGQRKIDFKTIDPSEASVTRYACSDAICTFLLCTHPKTSNVYTDKRFVGTYRLEKQVVQAVRLMERYRVKIDRAEVLKVMEEARKERQEFYDKITALADSKGFHGFNPGSPKQLSDFLFSEGGLDLKPKPPVNDKSRQYKTDAATLEALAEDPDAPDVLRWIVKYRQIDKIIGTYLESMAANADENDCLRFSFKQTGAPTGRFSAPAEDPAHGYAGVPPQGIPGRVDPKRPKCASSLRRVFVARESYTLSKCDYAGQELRVVTNLSGEPVWTKEFIEGSGDLHTITAKAFFGPHITKDNKAERQMGKTANFALVYGGGPAAIMRATKCNKIEAQRRKQAFDKSVPTFASWVKNQHVKVKKELGVFTAFGRWIAIPDANSDDEKVRAACERYSTNYPIQGSGADIMKISLVRLYKEFWKRGWLRDNGGDDSVRMLMTVHDEIVFEIKHERIPQAMPVIIDTMESPTFLAKPAWKVPLVVEPLLGRAWDGKYDWGEMREGRKLKPGDTPKESEYVIEDHAYSKVPSWLETILAFRGGKLIDLTSGADPTQPAAAIVLSDQAPTPPQSAAGPVQATSPEAPTSSPVPAQDPPSRPPPTAATNPPIVGGTATFTISVLSKATAHQVANACMAARITDPSKASLLRVKDISGNVIVDPAMVRIEIEPEKFWLELKERNLVAGRYAMEK